MPKPAVKAGTPPAGMNDRQEGWGTTGRVVGYPSGDDGNWPEYPTHLVPSEQLRNKLVEDEHPETQDGAWYRVERRIDDTEIHGYDEDGNPIQYVHYDLGIVGIGVVETDFERDQLNTGITFSDYPTEVPPPEESP